MRLLHFRLASVTRWLLVVVGCVVLETAQPAFAADPEISTEPRNESMIYPRGAEPGEPEGIAHEEPAGGLNWLTSALAVGMLGAGAWLLWRKRRNGLPKAGGRKIQIEETRPMGNRQYLIIARCEGRRFLLGVTPGRIDVVSPLDGTEAGE